MSDWPRCVHCGRWIDFDHPFARCTEIQFLTVTGEMDERSECECGPCAEQSFNTYGPSREATQ